MAYIPDRPQAPVQLPGAGNPVYGAIARAARKTGVSFRYLLDTATRESGLDPRAKAGTSSAAGLFQFIDQTWLGLLHRHGAAHGAGEAAQAIRRSPDGRYEIADQTRHMDIFALRFDPDLSAAMAGEYARECGRALEKGLGRAPGAGDLYAGHFLGASGAVTLIKAVRNTPDAPAADLFPQAAAANRAIFYAHTGRPRTVSEVLAKLTERHGAEGSVNESDPSLDIPPAPPRPALSGVRLPELRLTTASPSSYVLSPAMILALAAMDVPGSDARSLV